MKSNTSNGKTITQKVHVIKILNNCHPVAILSNPQQQAAPFIHGKEQGSVGFMTLFTKVLHHPSTTTPM
jgi:hypothetical protein